MVCESSEGVMVFDASTEIIPRTTGWVIVAVCPGYTIDLVQVAITSNSRSPVGRLLVSSSVKAIRISLYGPAGLGNLNKATGTAVFYDNHPLPRDPFSECV